MPKLRRVNGREVIALLQGLGFVVVRSRGSHQILKFGGCSVTVPVHGSDALAIGTLKQIYRDVLNCIPEEQLKPLFYTA